MASNLDGINTLEETPLKSAYTPSQIQHYLQHISFPLPLTHPRDALFLQTLHRCQITNIPYENLSLHYNPAHNNSINPQDLYAKFLPDFSAPGSGSSTITTKSRGRGGFCFETSTFFLHILRGIGFKAYPTSARIRIRDHFTRVPSGPFVGPRHVVNIILLDDGSIWSCDVGFGGDGPTSPLQLKRPMPNQADGREEVVEPETIQNLGTQDIRLRWGVFPDTVREEANKVWLYEYRNGGSGDKVNAGWNTYYAFGETEASPWDLECSNWWVATHDDSFQRKQVLVVKFIRAGSRGATSTGGGGTVAAAGAGGVHLDGEVNGANLSTRKGEVKVIGKLMLADGVLKRNMGGKTEVIKECRTEEERIEVLREYFGIYLTDDEKQGIKGFETELKG